MIRVTRLNGSIFYISPHQIELMEETPDTVITLVSGKKIVIREDVKTITERIIDYRKKIGNVLVGNEF